MTIYPVPRFLARAALALLVSMPVAAAATSGSVALTGASRLGVRGCGAHRSPLTGTLVVRDDGTWTEQSNEGGSYAGTYVATGKAGRTLKLTLDAASLAAIVVSVEVEVARLCDSQAVTVTSSTAKIVKLVLNRKGTKAKVLLKYVFRGTAGARSGSATYKAAGHGPWTALP